MQRAVAMVADVRSSFPSEQEAINAVAGVLGIDNPDEVREWMNTIRPDVPPDDRVPSKLKILKRFAFRSHTIVVGVLITVLGGLGLAYSQQLFGVGQPTAPGEPNLEVDQISLASQGWSDSPNNNTSDPNPFKVDIKLLNTGNRLAAINSAELVIQQVVVLPQCAGQSDFQPTGSYPVNLPIDPPAGTIVDVPVSQIVPANGADRFELLLRAKMPPKALGTKYVYRFQLYLTYNAKNTRLDLGEVIADYPVAPDQGEYFWSKYWAARPAEWSVMTATEGGTANITACDIKGSNALRSILSLPGARSKELTAIPSQLAYSP
jgi:hypothetical protein